MKNRLAIIVVLLVAGACAAALVLWLRPPPRGRRGAGTEQKVLETIRLPDPDRDRAASLEQTLLKRRSVREYADEPLTIKEVSQLCWAAQGVTHADGYRTAPSAGALYPIELYVAAGNVKGLAGGVYKYRPDGHELAKVLEGDKRAALYGAALEQSAVRDAAAVFLFSAVYERTTGKYGQYGFKYVHMEIGHAGQNLLLEAAALGLGAVPIGAFSEDEVASIVNMTDEEHALYIIPVGRKRD